ncbi:wax ester/triacylglycerol synthase domain-containing protein [Mycobacterium asiaticum]|uniref:wax ester/triacylglycerol synthase domain-containing protein n=1 Tax=Mycobacterium asiaticum TaxID=1790 RepID=UPI00055D26FD|nr:wax ester/triacylglycerol synthase domain-containing protein [Mycobacterium asiaticum]ORA09892.1 hypothetical protein BST16_23545 [Mycobacterium asiaticum DSM 44297]
MVERLTGIDALALGMGSSTMPTHVVSVAILEASDNLSHRRLQELVASSLPRMGRFRSRVVNKPWNCGQPVWAEDEDFDPGPHLHRASVESGSGRRGLTDLVAELTGRPLDRRRPLWEAWTIDNLDHGRWALALKMSPAIIGGVAGVSTVWRRLLDVSAHEGRSDVGREPGPGSRPSTRALVVDTVQELIGNQITGTLLFAGAVPAVLRAGIRLIRGTVRPEQLLPRTPSSMRGPVPRTIFNKALSGRRTTAFAAIPLPHIAIVTRAFGGSVENVVLAACTLSLRSWLIRYSELPRHPLSLQISLPSADADSASLTAGYRSGCLRFPVQLDDPVLVLTDLHTATEQLKLAGGDHADGIARVTDLATVACLLPPNLVHAGKRIYAGLGLTQRGERTSHGVVAALPGLPAPPHYCGGVKVLGIHTVAPLSESAGLNITLCSRGDCVDISVSVCPDTITSVEEIASGIVESIGILVAAADHSPRGMSPSVVTEMSSHAKARR